MKIFFRSLISFRHRSISSKIWLITMYFWNIFKIDPIQVFLLGHLVPSVKTSKHHLKMTFLIVVIFSKIKNTEIRSEYNWKWYYRFITSYISFSNSCIQVKKIFEFLLYSSCVLFFKDIFRMISMISVRKKNFLLY